MHGENSIQHHHRHQHHCHIYSRIIDPLPQSLPITAHAAWSSCRTAGGDCFNWHSSCNPFAFSLLIIALAASNSALAAAAAAVAAAAESNTAYFLLLSLPERSAFLGNVGTASATASELGVP
jgi:hypothetical protein